MLMFERAEARISLDAIMHNMEAMYARVPDSTQMVAVIKSDGYGHGAVEIAQEIEPKDYLYGFAVATLEEGIQLRQHGIKKPIMVLGFVFPPQYENAIRQGLMVPIFTTEAAKALSDTAVKMGKAAPFQLAVDTGMNRIGLSVSEESVKEAAEITRLPGIHAEGMFTHFFASDSADKTSANRQFEKFKWFYEQLQEEGVQIPHVHCSNSAALIDMPYAAMDLVRAGITLYGLAPSDEVTDIGLMPVMELVARVSYIKTVPMGETISYGGIYTAPSDRRIATIGFGYADGYPRSLSNKGYVLLHGKKAPICGRVCMDQFMVDVTDIPDAKIGDEAVLVGRSGDECITMEKLGDLSGRFNYEFACDIGKRVPRVFTKEGREPFGDDGLFLDETRPK